MSACVLILTAMISSLAMQGLSDGHVGKSAPLLDVDEAALKANELREGTALTLAPSIPCSVSFAPGQERRVHLGLHGLEQVET